MVPTACLQTVQKALQQLLGSIIVYLQDREAQVPAVAATAHHSPPESQALQQYPDSTQHQPGCHHLAFATTHVSRVARVTVDQEPVAGRYVGLFQPARLPSPLWPDRVRHEVAALGTQIVGTCRQSAQPSQISRCLTQDLLPPRQVQAPDRSHLP